MTAAGAVAIVATPVAAPLPQRVQLSELLPRLADYVAAYERAMSAIVAEEAYEQVLTGAGVPLTVRTRSDLGILLDPNNGWVSFRDVFEVNGNPVQDRQDRLGRLFSGAGGDVAFEARQIAAESSRFNLSFPDFPLTRTINVPMMPLLFLRKENQSRSTFQLAGDETIGGSRVAILRFRERDTPRMIATPNNAAATGSAWIDVVTGRIVKTELKMDVRDTDVELRTSYAPQAAFDVWPPVSMEELYRIGVPRGAGRRIEGRATYSNFRRFGVTVDTETYKPTP